MALPSVNRIGYVASALGWLSHDYQVSFASKGRLEAQCIVFSPFGAGGFCRARGRVTCQQALVRVLAGPAVNFALALPLWFAGQAASVAARPVLFTPSFSRSALDFVVNPSHHRLVHLDARCREDRQKGYPECVGCLLRLPNVENLDLAVRLKSDVGDASVGSSCTRFFKLDERCVVTLLGKALSSDIEPSAIRFSLRGSARWFVQQCRGLYSSGARQTEKVQRPPIEPSTVHRQLSVAARSATHSLEPLDLRLLPVVI